MSMAHHKGPNFDWTAERIEELTTLWMSGQTAGQIAKAYGVTRNSIIGKVHRLGLRRCADRKIANIETNRARGFIQRLTRKPRPQPLLAVNIARKRQADVRKAEALRDRDDDGKFYPFDPAPALRLPESNPRPWTTRAFGECAYPLDDPDGGEILSCCLKVVQGRSYCLVHHAVMFQPAAPAKRKSDLERIADWDQARREAA